MNFIRNGVNFFLIIFVSNIFKVDAKLKFKYPTSITLENNNIFVIEENGIYICDNYLNEILNTVLSFDNGDKISTLDKLSTVILIKRSYYIISLINYKIYFFQTNGDFIFSSENLIGDCSPTSISLTPFYYYLGLIDYSIAYFDSNIKLKILYFYFDMNSKKNELKYTRTEDDLKKRNCDLTSCFYDSNDYHFSFANQGLSCVFLYDYYLYNYNYYEYDYLVCFFVAKSSNKEYLQELIFYVEGEEIKLSTGYKHDYINFNLNSITQIRADRNNNFDQSLVCVSTTTKNSYCYKFRLNMDEAEFYKYISFKTKCRYDLYSPKVNYLYETSQVVFSCLLSEDIGGIQTAIFGTSLETPNYSYKIFLGCSNIYGHSLIYSSPNYYIISDVDCTDTQDSKKFIDVEERDLIIELNSDINAITEFVELVEEEEKTDIIETKIGSTIIYPVEFKKSIIELNSELIPTECNSNFGYFPLSNSDPPQLEKCINKEVKEQNYPDYYFDTKSGFYRPCYEKCQTCSEKGDGKNNNCLTCATGYIFQPDYEESQNCVPKYKYLYYYNEYNRYSTTETPNCPEKFPSKIIEKNKCIDKCDKDHTFKYTYNNICFERCPNNTLNGDGDYFCKDDPNKCVLTSKKIFIANESLINNEINNLIEKYAKEYNYTENHISIINLGNYNITLYKNKYCVSELAVSTVLLDLSSVLPKIKQHYNMSQDEELIVGIVKNNSGHESFEMYNPKSGIPLNIFDICQNDTYSIQKSLIEELSSNSRVDFNDIQDMANQDINVIDLNVPFYNDICFHYKTKFNKDIPLKERALIYYPNISLCDKGCELEAVFIKNWTAKCNCYFGNSKNKLKDNGLYQSQFGDFEELVSLANINVMKCYKDIFKLEFFLNSKGNFIILFLILVDIICTVIFCFKSMFYIKRYIFVLTGKYMKYLKNQNQNPSHSNVKFNYNDNNVNITHSNEEKKENSNSNPPKSSYSNKGIDINNSKINNNTLEGNVIKSNRRKRGMSTNNLNVFINRNSRIGNLNLMTNNLKNKEYSYHNNNEINSSSKVQMNYKEKANLNKRTSSFNLTELNNKALNLAEKNPINDLELCMKDGIDINIEEYLNTEPDEMDYDEAIRRDNRKFCRYYWEKIQSNQILINTFYFTEYLKPRPIKLILLSLQIDLYFLINGLFYNEEYAKKIFYLEEDNLYKAFLRFTDNLFYAFLVGIIINYIIEFFFIEEKKLRVTLKREKDNILILKYEMVQIIKDIANRYITFIIISFVISIITWYHLYCFNNIYPHMQKEWLIFSVLIILCIQILSLIATFAETIIRFLSFKFKSEKLFKLSQLLS